MKIHFGFYCYTVGRHVIWQKTKKYYIFLKIEFEKPYNQAVQKHIIDLLEHMGRGTSFDNIVRTLLGNVVARACVNLDFIESFRLRRSMRQGYLLAPLFHAIVGDSQNWLL